MWVHSNFTSMGPCCQGDLKKVVIPVTIGAISLKKVRAGGHGGELFGGRKDRSRRPDVPDI